MTANHHTEEDKAERKPKFAYDKPELQNTTYHGLVLQGTTCTGISGTGEGGCDPVTQTPDWDDEG